MTPPMLADAEASTPTNVVSSPRFDFGLARPPSDRCPSEVRLRSEPRAEDVQAVERMLATTGFFSDEEIAVAGQIVRQRLSEGESSDYSIILADNAAGIPIGYICFGRIAFTQTSYDVYWIVVDPDAQGAGLGGHLLREAESAIAARRGTQVFIETAGRAQYAPTRRFYERHGYREAARLSDFYAPDDDKVVFAKRV